MEMAGALGGAGPLALGKMAVRDLFLGFPEGFVLPFYAISNVKSHSD